MNEKYKMIYNLLNKFSNLGKKNTDNGDILIGNPSEQKPYWWLNIIYRKVDENQVCELEKLLDTSIPESYKDFLINFGNGLDILDGTLALYGYRLNNSRVLGNYQPYSLRTPNISERPKNAKQNYFFIGTYNWDGSNLYIDKETGKVHFCARRDAKSLYEWASLEDMLLEEIPRIYKHFTDDGKELDETVSTLPVN